MKFHRYKNRLGNAGSTILMGLMVMAFGTAGIAAWVSLLSARSEQVNNYELQLQNRIAKLNSEAIVKQAIYSKCLNSNKRIFKFYRVPETNNSVIVRGTNESAFLSNITPENYIRIGQGNGAGFQSSVLSSIFINKEGFKKLTTDLAPEHFSRRYYLRSRSANLSGDLFVMHKSKESIDNDKQLDGNIFIHGNSFLWDASNIKVGEKIKTESYIMSSLNDKSNAPLLKNHEGEIFAPLNFPVSPRTGGNAITENAYSGMLNIIDPEGDAPWSVTRAIEKLAHVKVSGKTKYNRGRGVVVDGNGAVQIDLGSTFLTNVIVNDNVKSLHLKGQSDFVFNRADQLPAVAIVVNSSNDSIFNLGKITFDGKNMRRLVLCVKGREGSPSDPVEMIFTGSLPRTVWRTILVAENVPLIAVDSEISVGEYNLIGGISTDRSFKWSNDSRKPLNLSREESSNFLEYIAPRTAWLETNK